MFDDSDSTVQKALLYLLIFQVVEIIPVGVFIVLQQTALALLLLGVTLLLLILVLVFAYLRYRKHPRVVEKRSLLERTRRLEQSIRAYQQKIDQAQRRLDSLARLEQAEVAAALKLLQQAYVLNGLRSRHIVDADITGIGPTLKQRLAARGVTTATDVTQASISGVEGLGETKASALVNWRSDVEFELERTKPATLPIQQAEDIAAKYRAQQGESTREIANAKGNKQTLETELNNHLPRLDPFARITFWNYLANAVASDNAGARRIFGAMGAATIVLCALTSVGVVASSGRDAPAPLPTLDYAQIATSAFSTAFAERMSTISAETAKALPTPSPVDTPTVAPQSTSTPSNPVTNGIAGATCIPNNPVQTGTVVGIVDGGTIRVLLAEDGKVYSVRYIGIDAPGAGDPYFNDATRDNTDLAYGKQATLIKDTSETDAFGSLLRYVIVGRKFVNFELVVAGAALSHRSAPDTACSAMFEAAQAGASAAGRGMWALPTP